MNRIAKEIATGRWKFNGDTIKISTSGDVLDGQHRLWAVIETNTPIETVVIEGMVERDAFTTIDTLRKSRSGSDVIALNGVTRHRNWIAQALTWLTRYQRGVLVEFRQPENKVENQDIENAFKENPNIIQAVERCGPLRSVGNVGVLSFIYYVASTRNPELADRMLDVLEDPSIAGVNNPFFKFRQWLMNDARKHKQISPVLTTALAFKALNAAKQGKSIGTLKWCNQGHGAEDFPKLSI